MAPVKKKPPEILSNLIRSVPGDKTLDVLRVLVLNLGALWLSELVNELSSLHLFKKEPSMSEAEVDQAVVRLASEGFLKVELGVKASMTESKDDKLVSLADIRLTSRALSKDKTLLSYKRFLMAPLKKPRT